MAAREKRDLADIIRTQKKGFRAVRSAGQPDSAAPADAPFVAQSASLDDLKARFLPDDMLGQPASRPATAGGDDLEMVQVEPDKDADAGDVEGPGRKSVIVSHRSGEIIGEQG